MRMGILYGCGHYYCSAQMAADCKTVESSLEISLACNEVLRIITVRKQMIKILHNLSPLFNIIIGKYKKN